MIRWKDFFYFSKGDKLGVLLLLVLVFISGGIYIYLSNFSKVDVGYYQFAEDAQREFVEFEEQLEPKEIVRENDINSTDEQSAETTPKNKTKDSSKLTSGQVIDINSASSKTLMRIPGIGKAYAERIVEYRTALGGFYDLSQLKEIKGITNNKFIQILPYMTIKKKHSVTNFNRVSRDRLLKHPYLSEEQVDEFLTLRETSKLKTADDLLINNIFLPKDIE